MRRLMTVFIFSMGILLFLATTQASAFTYSEGTDLGDGLPAATVFSFGIGVNSISGTSFDLPGGFDRDSFAFSIPSGTQLTQISYSFAGDISGTLAVTRFQLELGNVTNNTLADTGSSAINLLGTSPVAPFGAVLPLGPNVYGIYNIGVGISNPGGWTINYEWDFTVAESVPAAPEPATMLFLGCGLIGLWGARRKLKK